MGPPCWPLAPRPRSPCRPGEPDSDSCHRLTQTTGWARPGPRLSRLTVRSSEGSRPWGSVTQTALLAPDPSEPPPFRAPAPGRNCGPLLPPASSRGRVTAQRMDRCTLGIDRHVDTRGPPVVGAQGLGRASRGWSRGLRGARACAGRVRALSARLRGSAHLARAGSRRPGPSRQAVRELRRPRAQQPAGRQRHSFKLSESRAAALARILRGSWSGSFRVGTCHQSSRPAGPTAAAQTTLARADSEPAWVRAGFDYAAYSMIVPGPGRSHAALGSGTGNALGDSAITDAVLEIGPGPASNSVSCQCNGMIKTWTCMVEEQANGNTI